MNEGIAKQSIKTRDSEKEPVLDIMVMEKICLQMRGQALLQLREVSNYCGEQRKCKNPANNLKVSWARAEISALSTLLNALKNTELEIIKSKLEVIENAIRRKNQ